LKGNGGGTSGHTFEEKSGASDGWQTIRRLSDAYN